MTAQNAAVQKQKMHQRITVFHLLTAKIEQDPHLQFLIFMHYSCMYAGKSMCILTRMDLSVCSILAKTISVWSTVDTTLVQLYHLARSVDLLPY